MTFTQYVGVYFCCHIFTNIHQILTLTLHGCGTCVSVLLYLVDAWTKLEFFCLFLPP